mgnify:CR=1 FL=1
MRVFQHRPYHAFLGALTKFFCLATVLAFCIPAIAQAPANVKLIPGDTQIKVTWDGNGDYTKSYRIDRKQQGGSYAPVKTVGGGGAGMSWTDNNVVNGTTYYYIIHLMSPSTILASSAEQSAIPNVPPPAPTGVTAQAASGRITLTWSASPGATSYIVKRGTSSGGSYNTYASGITTTTFTDENVSSGQAYYYVVIADLTGVPSVNSSQASATAYLDAPVLAASAGNGVVNLSWAAVPGAKNGYKLFRSLTAGSYGSALTSPGSSATSYTDNVGTANNGKTYFYVLKAVDGGSGSPLSNEVSATPTSPPSTAPGGFSAVSGSGSIVLAWSAVAGATDYVVYRSVAGGVFEPLATSVPLSYTDSNVSSGVSYTYYVKARNAGGEGPPSVQQTATPSHGWTLSTGISCAGIRPLPLAPGQTSIPAGSAIRISAHLATDYDVRTEKIDGVITNRILSDTCTYSWSSAAGSVENGISTGPSIVWIAPATPGTYTVYLTVDDQNAANIGAGEAGARNDDPALQFSINILVQ